MTRRVAAAIVLVQTVAELVYVAGRHDLAPGMRVFLMCVVLLQLVFAQGVLRSSAGSVFGLLALQAMTVVAAIAADGPVGLRVLWTVAALTVIALVLRSLSEFPPAALPRPTSRP